MEDTNQLTFSDTVIDHAQQPRNFGPLLRFNGHARVTGACGDTMEFWVLFEGERVEAVSFVTDGCGPSLASGSATTCLAQGQMMETILNLRQADVLRALNGLPRGVEHCALLAVDALRAACEDYSLRRSSVQGSLVLAGRGGALSNGDTPVAEHDKEVGIMRIAIPLAGGRLAQHFGHCESFALIDVDPETKQAVKREDIEAPPHQPGLLPRWLAEKGANLIIAGGMGQRALDLFAQQRIAVVLGAPVETPERLVVDHLCGSLQTGANACDH